MPQIVIDIPDNFNLENEINTVDNPVIRRALKNGTLLPKHYGRLVDADKVESTLKNHAKNESEAWALVELLNVLDEVPTVLVATKEGEGE